jgi:hypothetical protein
MYNQIVMKPQEIVIILKIISLHISENIWNTLTLSRDLMISQSEISESLKRSVYCGFISQNRKDVFKNALLEYIIHGIKYSFPVKPGAMVRGVPTAHSAPPLSTQINSPEVFVWPYHDGPARGFAIEPLYKTVPQAILSDNLLYEMLSLVDAVRAGKARERNLAENILNEYLNNRI